MQTGAVMIKNGLQLASWNWTELEVGGFMGGEGKSTVNVYDRT